VIAQCRALMAHFKARETVVFVDALPRRPRGSGTLADPHRPGVPPWAG
jgi:hypothetical protein